jgi:hypothetical protein
MSEMFPFKVVNFNDIFIFARTHFCVMCSRGVFYLLLVSFNCSFMSSSSPDWY